MRRERGKQVYLFSNKIAGGGARTHTILRSLDFESSASASSATPAQGILKLRRPRLSSSVRCGENGCVAKVTWLLLLRAEVSPPANAKRSTLNVQFGANRIGGPAILIAAALGRDVASLTRGLPVRDRDCGHTGIGQRATGKPPKTANRAFGGSPSSCSA